MMTIANPIYDSVFKFLMEDERVARTILSVREGPDGNVEMQRIVRRLLMAASDTDMRMDMNVEDEYYSIIEKRGTELLKTSKELDQERKKNAEQASEMKQLKFRMLSRYKKIEEDSRFSAAEDRGRYSVCCDGKAKLTSFISFYLLLTPSIYKASKACES